MNAPFRMFAAITLSALIMGAYAVFPETTEQFHKVLTLKEGTPVQVENVSGKVDISVWDQPTVDIQAIKRAHKNPRDLERVSIDIDSNGKLYIKTSYHRGDKNSSFSRLFGNWGEGPNVSVDYTIKLPRTAVLREVSTVSADIIVRDARGDAHIHSVSGDVRLTNLPGPVALETTSGEAEMIGGTLKSAETVSGNLKLRSVSGNVDVNSTSGDISVEGVSGKIGAHSISGDISITGMQMGKIETVSGDISISPSMLADTTDISTISGDIRLRVPSGTNADVKMDTVSGELRTDGDVGIKITQMSRGHISAKIGAGGKILSVNTTSGDMTLEK